jgi:hypothetical protein
MLENHWYENQTMTAAHSHQPKKVKTVVKISLVLMSEVPRNIEIPVLD